MKNLIVIFLSLFLVGSNCHEVVAQKHFDIKIGLVKDGKASLTVDMNKVKDQWQNIISNHSTLDPEFETIEIKQEEGNYFLLALGSKYLIKSRIDLVLEKGILYEAKFRGEEGITISCSGCQSTGPGSASECIPSKDGKGGAYCTDCSAGSCTKTITVSEISVLSSFGRD